MIEKYKYSIGMIPYSLPVLKIVHVASIILILSAFYEFRIISRMWFLDLV